MSAELKPCPFCGGEAAVDNSFQAGPYCGCRACDFWVTKDLWNRRVTILTESEQAARDAELAELRAKIQSAETRAWRIVCEGEARILAHNAIADYRQIDPNSTVAELIERPL